LLLYVWLGEFWLAAYNVPDYPGEARKMRRLLQFHPTSLILAVVLIGAGWFYKKHFAPPEDQVGFPGYFTFLVAGALLPAVSFFPVARRFINWRALSLTLFLTLLVSLLWEATLAVPYNWWNYQPRQMMGLFIGAWSGLPIRELVSGSPLPTPRRSYLKSSRSCWHRNARCTTLCWARSQGLNSRPPPCLFNSVNQASYCQPASVRN
jgi:hypothetical protein